MTIRHKLTFGFVGIAFLIFVVSYFSANISEKTLKESIGENFILLMEENLSKMDRILHTRIEAMQDYTHNRFLRESIKKSNTEFDKMDNIEAYIRQKDSEWISASEEEETPFMQQLLNNALSRELKEKVVFYEESSGFKVYSEIFVTNKYGVVIGSSGKTSDYFQADEKWYQNAIKAKDLSVEDIGYDKSAKYYSSDIIIGVHNKKGEFVGVLKAVLNIEEQIEIIRKMVKSGPHSEHQTMNFKLLTKDWKVIYSTKKFRFLEDVPDNLQFHHDEHGALDHFFVAVGDKSDDPKIFSAHAESKGHRNYKGLGWVLLFEHNVEELFSPVIRLRKGLFLISLTIIILALLIGVYLARTLTRPILILRDAAKEIGEGKLDTRIDVKAGDEIGQLAETFSKMAKNLKESMTSITNYEKEIIDRKQAQESLIESEERFRSISDSAQDAIIMMDNKGEITYWNKAAENIFQYKSNEVLHKDLHALLVPKRYHELFKNGFEKFLITGEGQAIGKILDLWAKRKNGVEFPVELSLSSVKIKGKWNAIGIIRDISERVKAEKDKNELKSQLAQAQKMESIGTLAGGIAHDFNNILTSIIGYTELALTDVEKGTLIEENLQEVRQGGNRATDLVKQILTFARQGEKELRPLRVSLIAKEALKLIRSAIPTSIQIEQNIVSESSIMGDTTRIHQIFMNLCTNAAQAMEDDGGVLKVSLTDVGFDAGHTETQLSLKSGNYLELTVSDTGTGISPDVIQSIFEPYYTTKELGQGTGMGLAMVHGIVKSHGGEIAVESEVGKGTEFRIYLPVTKKATESIEYKTEDLPTGTERILFVDDELSIANMGRQILERQGYTVTIRTSSMEALALFRNKPDRFDLVITDMAMPHMTGDKFAVELMEIRPDIPVIICTGYSKRISEEQAAEIGIKAFTMKPLVMRDLANTVRKVLDAAKK